MNNNLSTVTIRDECYAVILDAVQRAIIDKYASKATRKAAFSVLLALMEAGVVAGETPVSSTRRDSVSSTTRDWVSSTAIAALLRQARKLA